MSTENKKPLVSFIINAYQQEEFIREAVHSALNQTYKPLEIILSDDSSSDDTFKIMEEEAKSYNGPHDIILNRNEKNIGLIRHLEYAVSLSHGDYIVTQAGDDISLPHRTETLLMALKQPTTVDLVCSDVRVIDEAGKLVHEGWKDPIISPLTLDEAVLVGRSYALGCAAGYNRKLFDDFSPMNEFVFQEDNVLTFRALARNGVRIVPEILVEYRKHSDNIFHGKGIVQNKKNIKRDIKNQYGITCDRLVAWDACGKPRNSLRDELVLQNKYLLYRSGSTESNLFGLFQLTIKGLLEGLPLRKTFGLFKLWFSLR